MAEGVKRIAPSRWALSGRDGRRFELRPIRPEDAPALQRAFLREDPEDVRMRLLQRMPRLPDRLARRLCECEPGLDVCLVLVDPERPEELLGGARVMRDGPGAARGEYAVSMASELKGQGLGRRVLETVLEQAEAIGVREIWGYVARDNRAMRGLARRLGMKERPDPDDRGIIVTTR